MLTRSIAVKGFFFFMGLMIVSGGVGVAQAGPKPVIKPAGKNWCGITDQNGTVRLTFSDDLRFADQIAIQQGPPETLFLSTGEGEFGGTVRAALLEDQFIFRRVNQETICRQGPSTRCTRAPCRGEPRICQQLETNTLTIRGFLDAPESLRGTFSALVTEQVSNGRTSRSRRVLGSFIAWPEGVAPCP